jgi:SAM-dependent methyltransferase
MIEHKRAGSHKDVGAFYNEKYSSSGYGTFSNNDRRPYADLLEDFGGTFSDGASILDAGCGNGEFLAYLPAFMVRYGIDASDAAVRLAKARFSGQNATIVCGDLETANEVFGDKPVFDYISTLGVLEHTMNPKKAFDCLLALLKPGGSLLVLVPLVFDDCLGQLRQEENQVTNERFATATEWIDFFGTAHLAHHEILGTGASKDIALVYVKKGDKQ